MVDPPLINCRVPNFIRAPILGINHSTTSMVMRTSCHPRPPRNVNRSINQLSTRAVGNKIMRKMMTCRHWKRHGGLPTLLGGKHDSHKPNNNRHNNFRTKDKQMQHFSHFTDHQVVQGRVDHHLPGKETGHKCQIKEIVVQAPYPG